MKLISYRDNGELLVGFLGENDKIVPIPLIVRDGLSPIRALLNAGPEAVYAARSQAEAAFVSCSGLRELADVEVAPLIPDPDKILCVGFNYLDHIAEMAIEHPSEPNIFAKFRNALIADGGVIKMPPSSSQIDFEGELAVVIGRICNGATEANALEFVAGYTVFNDVSARDLQFQTSQYTLGKAIDTFGPLGPVMALARDVPDPRELRVATRLNGELMQDESVAKMLYDVPKIIASISAVITLVPGDVISTGTPAGVGWKRTPPRFMVEGDVIEVEVSGVGKLRNTVGA
ncbi:MAG: fumarylacetoacetate hydrolase family protein [Sphingomonas sp.]